MSLGRREARHQTSASAKVAGVEPSSDWDFQPGQRVQTVDGLPGIVSAVEDGPVRGAEGYQVTLDDGMGGGLYTSSQLTAEPHTTAVVEHTAADDYPELEDILTTRPDIARNTVLGGLKQAADGDLNDDGDDGFGPEIYCTECGTYHGKYRHKGSRKRSPAKDYDGVDTSVGGANLSNGMTSSTTGSLQVEAEWSYAHHAMPIVHLMGQRPQRPLQTGDLVMHPETGFSDEVISHSPNLLNMKQSGIMHRGPVEGDLSKAIWSSDSVDEAGKDVPQASHDQLNYLDSNTQGPSKYSAKVPNVDEGGWSTKPREGYQKSESQCDRDGHGYWNNEGTCLGCGYNAGNNVDHYDWVSHAFGGDEKKINDADHLLGQNSIGPTKYSKIASADEYQCGTDHWPKNADPRERLGDTDCGHPECPYRPCDHEWCVKNEAPHNVTEHNMAPPGHLDPYSDESQESEQRLKDALSPHKEELDWQFEQRDPHDESGPSKYSSIYDPFDLLVTASTDPDFRFEITAAWSDVRAKAKRIRAEGGVHVTLASDGTIFAEVKGDHNVYETGLQRLPGKQSAQQWSCGCKWGAYHWGANDDFSRFAGRMCSHALALQFEAQSRGMFGRNIDTDTTKPSWAPRKVVVKYDIDADRNRRAPATQPEYGRVATRSALNVLAHYAKAEGFTEGDFTVECVLAGITGAVNSPWGEPQAEVPEVTGPTRPPHATDNPASMGWASQADPDSWGGLQTPDTLSMGASLDDEFMFEAGGGPVGFGDESLIPTAGDEAALHDEPEPALPHTDSELALGNGSPDGGAMGTGSAEIKGDPTSLEPEDPSIMSMGSTEDIVASFQQKAAHLNPQGGGGQGDGDIAAAAREHLAKAAVKDFTPGEQANLINEGEHVVASNLDRLDIAGTHYEPLEAALAARDSEEDDDGWMA